MIRAKKIRNILIKLGLVLFSSFLTYKLVYFIGERYFFDKFFYNKNIKYGYWVKGEKLSWYSFGKRGEDLVKLNNDNINVQKDNESKKVLGRKDDGVYMIAVIGDSMVWGTGIRDKYRLVNILEKRLNKIYPTKILSLGNFGDSIVDNYIKYKMLKKAGYEVDLYIFGLIDNDLIFESKERYDFLMFNNITSSCGDKSLYFDSFEEISYNEKIKKTFSDDFGNFCVLEKIADLLPKKKAIYFDFSISGKSEYLEIYRDVLRKKDLLIKEYVDSSCEVCEKCDCYFVSEKERHPSALANKKYAEVLYNEITTNSEHGFIEKIAER